MTSYLVLCLPINSDIIFSCCNSLFLILYSSEPFCLSTFVSGSKIYALSCIIFSSIFLNSSLVQFHKGSWIYINLTLHTHYFIYLHSDSGLSLLFCLVFLKYYCWLLVIYFYLIQSASRRLTFVSFFFSFLLTGWFFGSSYSICNFLHQQHYAFLYCNVHSQESWTFVWESSISRNLLNPYLPSHFTFS